MQSLFSLLISRVIGSKSTVLVEKKDKTVKKIPTKFCKNSLNADMFLQVLEKQGKILSWPMHEKHGNS